MSLQNTFDLNTMLGAFAKGIAEEKARRASNPPSPKKIAIIGSAPSSVTKAPYADPSWQIWGVSPGAYPHCRRIDTFFEIHSRTLDPSVFSGDYLGFLNQAPRVFLLEPWPEIPNGTLFPFGKMLKKWGPYWFSSSVSWMMAAAIEEGVTEIGLWGIDMSASEEYVGQRPACQRWMEVCAELGIKVTLPIESDLNRPFPLYGLCEADPMYVKMLNRKGELMMRYNAAKQRLHAAEIEARFLEGAVDCINYDTHVWVADRIMQRYMGTDEPEEAERPKLAGPPPENPTGTLCPQCKANYGYETNSFCEPCFLENQKIYEQWNKGGAHRQHALEAAERAKLGIPAQLSEPEHEVSPAELVTQAIQTKRKSRRGGNGIRIEGQEA